MPRIGPGELLLKVVASGICGTDVLEWYRLPKAPRVLGHEVTGDIVAVGDGVVRYQAGDRAFVSHHVPCNSCSYCLKGYHTACHTLRTTNFDPGGFAEYIRAPQINVERGVYLLPPDLSYEEGTFIEPLGCCLRGQRLANIQPGDCVLIIGSGISGLLHIRLARARGAGSIIATDIDEARLQSARRSGADEVIHATEDVPARVRQINDHRPADRVIICTGALPAIRQALRSVDNGGRALFFAVPEPGVEVSIPITDFWRREVTVLTSYGAAPDLEAALELLRTHQIKVADLITHRLSLRDIAYGFQLVAHPQNSLKVIIEPHH